MRPRPTWQIVAEREARELWLGGRGLWMLLAFTTVLGVMTFVTAQDAALNLLDARESVGIVVQTAIGLGALVAMFVAADAISGERERGTLEALLVTPMSRRGFVVGKLVAATSVWLGAFIAAVPYVIVLSRGPGLIADALVALLLAGSLTAAALTALGLAVSALTRTNRASLAVAATTLVILGAPSQLPAINADTPVGAVLIQANPVSAGLRLAKEVLVLQSSWSAVWTYLLAPVIGAVGLTLLATKLSSRVELGGAR